ncbi:AAA family ATPase [Primorskyibacter aestuariivivens]|uniref:AAA family ATPase n=1 Tax=Primorskyibacter aestuariivivens TaxID=1888912 RepID=UPI0023014463|nr:AAA family ATPase [Primorskyibacter aestuariivivens]MDA7428441.1 AAA family ATPase [Primorskyibacter aestuariivivens]
MTDETALEMEMVPLVACTISRDVQEFELLIEDMENALGEQWGDLGFDEALPFFEQEDSEPLEFIAIAMDAEDEEELHKLSDIIGAAKERGIKVILIAEDVSPAALHHLLRKGADEFVPYPLPESELQFAIDRLRATEPEPVVEAAVPAPVEAPAVAPQVKLHKGASREGAILAIHGLAGGVGATTFATNLAWELATVTKTDAPKVCLLDLDLQFGSVATYLDLPRRDSVYELLSDIESMDQDSFSQALMTFEDTMEVLTAPADMLPLDLLPPEDIQKLLDTARAHFDYVIVDMPKTLVQWSETVLHAAHVYFAMIELDMRSAQNALRMKRALQSEDLPFDKLRFILNHAPKFTDLSGKSRVKRMAESLGIAIEVQFPDGGKPVLQACDHGLPLATAAAKNPLRKEINKLAASLIELGRDDAEAA